MGGSFPPMSTSSSPGSFPNAQYRKRNKSYKVLMSNSEVQKKKKIIYIHIYIDFFGGREGGGSSRVRTSVPKHHKRCWNH